MNRLKFLVDECAGRKLYNSLKENGFDTEFVADKFLAADDSVILTYAEKENRVLITNDKDFGELLFRLNSPSSGVILLRLRADTSENRRKVVLHTISNFKDKLSSHLVVVNESKIRICKLNK